MDYTEHVRVKVKELQCYYFLKNVNRVTMFKL